MLQSSDRPHGPLWDLLQRFHVVVVLQAPEVTMVLQVGAQQEGGRESPLLTCWLHFFNNVSFN